MFMLGIKPAAILAYGFLRPKCESLLIGTQSFRPASFRQLPTSGRGVIEYDVVFEIFKRSFAMSVNKWLPTGFPPHYRSKYQR